jgi:WD40 repeat protein
MMVTFTYGTQNRSHSWPLTEHSMEVDLLDVTPSGLLLRASADKSVRIWNLTTLSCLSSLSNSALQSFSVMYQLRALSNTQLVIGGATNKLQFIAIRSDNVLSLNGSIELANSNADAYDFRLTSQNVLVILNSDGTVSFLNANTLEYTQTVMPKIGNVPYFIDIIGLEIDF